jgi:hypothetical protein
MTPYVTIASEAMMNATYTLNNTAQDFMVHQWPQWVDNTAVFWERFKADPNNWIALYPLTLFFFALVIWNSQGTNGGRAAYKNVDEAYTSFDDILRDNMMARRARRMTIFYYLEQPEKGTHPMIRRSQGPAAFYMLE